MSRKLDGGIFAAIILILVGVLALLGRVLPFNAAQLFTTYLFLAIGLPLIAGGIYTREAGWFIPGGILTGLAAGFALLIGPLTGIVPVDNGGAAFLFSLAGGFALITLLSVIFTQGHHWWALIPATILGFVGLAVARGGIFWEAVDWLQWIWPVALILLGIKVLWHVRRGSVAPEDDNPPVEKHA
jgi:hypothetical protein